MRIPRIHRATPRGAKGDLVLSSCTLALALVCLLALAAVSCDRLQQQLIERRAEGLLEGDRQDGMHFTLPPNSEEILREDLD